jgi:hypothetical protein
MSRRYFLTTAGILLGLILSVFGLYLSRAHASDQSATKTAPDNTVTISARDLKKLVERVTSLEARVRALEDKSGTLLINDANGPLVLPEARDSDGFAPVKTILIDSNKSPK